MREKSLPRKHPSIVCGRRNEGILDMHDVLPHDADDVKPHVHRDLVAADEGVGSQRQTVHLGRRDSPQRRRQRTILARLDLHEDQRMAVLSHDVEFLTTTVVPVAGHDAIPFINKVLGGLVLTLLSGNVMLCHGVIQFLGDKSTKIYPLFQTIEAKTLTFNHDCTSPLLIIHCLFCLLFVRTKNNG